MRQQKTTGPTAMTNTAADRLGAAPADTKYNVKSIIVTNIDSSAHTFTISKGADAAGTRLWAAVSIAANTTTTLYPTGLTLETAEKLQAYADANSVVNMTFNYDAITID